MDNLNYGIEDNPITPDPENKKGRIIQGKPIDLDELFDMADDLDTVVSRSDMIASIHVFFRVFEKALLTGRPVQLPIGTFHLGLKGPFHTFADVFDRLRHKVVIKFRGSTPLLAKIKRLRMTKVDLAKRAPKLDTYYDAHSKTYNSVLSPGGGGKLTGHNLKFNPDDPEQGLSLIGNLQTFPVIEFQDILPSELNFVLRNHLPPGEYKFVLRAILYGSSKVSVCELDKVLIVSDAS